MIKLLFVAPILAACGGGFVSVVPDSIDTKVLDDGRVQLTIAVRATGTEDWPAGYSYCVVSHWKHPLRPKDKRDEARVCSARTRMTPNDVEMLQLTSTKPLAGQRLTIVTRLRADYDHINLDWQHGARRTIDMTPVETANP